MYNFVVFSNPEKKIYYKYLVRKFVTDVYLGKWLRMNTFKYFVEPELGLGNKPGARALDIGTGDGILSFHLAGRYPELRVTGWDIDAIQVTAAESVARKLNIKNLNFEILEILDFSTKEPVEFLFTLDILEHIEDDMAAVKNCAKLLKPGGLWTISVPNRLMLTGSGEWVPSLGPPDHVRTGYDLDVLEKMVKAAGLDVVMHRYYTGEKMIKAWELFCRLDRIARPATLIGMPYYNYSFKRDSYPAPEIGNAFFLVARKPQ